MSRLFIGQTAIAYSLLLLATIALGGGFGMTLTMLNLYVVGFFPTKPDTAVTALHTLLGTGTALAPLLMALFVGRGVVVVASSGRCCLGDPNDQQHPATAASRSA